MFLPVLLQITPSVVHHPKHKRDQQNILFVAFGKVVQQNGTDNERWKQQGPVFLLIHHFFRPHNCIIPIKGLSVFPSPVYPPDTSDCTALSPLLYHLDKAMCSNF